MARRSRRRPLYEVIGGGRLKSRFDKRLGQQPGDESDSLVQAGTPVSGFVWPKKPRLAQLNMGRVELSVPYPVVVAVFLGIVVLLLLAFRLGQWQGKQKSEHSSSTELAQVERKLATERPALFARPQEKPVEHRPIAASPPVPGPKGERIRMVEPMRDHRIVIQQHQIRADLIPVQKYFAENGVETLIENAGNWWFLVTKEFYQNPERKGTDGYKTKNQIIKLGADYKAPEGYGTFAPHFFSDAYGKKVR